MCSLVSMWSLLAVGEAEALLCSPDGPVSGPILRSVLAQSPRRGQGWELQVGPARQEFASKPRPGRRPRVLVGNAATGAAPRAENASLPPPGGCLRLPVSRSEKGGGDGGDRTEPGV